MVCMNLFTAPPDCCVLCLGHAKVDFVGEGCAKAVHPVALRAAHYGVSRCYNIYFRFSHDYGTRLCEGGLVPELVAG